MNVFKNDEYILFEKNQIFKANKRGKINNISINYKQKVTLSFNIVRASIYLCINKNIPNDIEDIDDLPKETECYNAINEG